MLKSKRLPDIGRHVFGAAGIVLGLAGLIWQDFATIWQPIQAFGDVPHRQVLACIYAVCFIVFGLLALGRRTARCGVAGLAGLHLIAALMWMPRVIGFPRMWGVWGGFLEQLSMPAAAVVGFAALAPAGTRWAPRTAQVGRVLFAVCAISFGVSHFSALEATAGMVPKWMPGAMFWAVVTGVLHLAAGLAILTGVLDEWASQLYTVMLAGFGLLVWLPTLISAPKDHVSWAGNAIHWSITGAAWMVADWIATRKRGDVEA